MGYKVNESDLANKLNYHMAMYKGDLVILLAKDTTSDPSYWDSPRTFKLFAKKIDGNPSGPKFHVDVTEPTFSAAIVQGGYIFDTEGRLGYIEIINGAADVKWFANSGFHCPNTDTTLMLDCVKNKHPTFAEAVKKVTGIGRAKACSFDRHFALVRDTGFSDINIHYKYKSIGYYDAKTNRAKLRNGPTVKLLKRKLDKLME